MIIFNVTFRRAALHFVLQYLISPDVRNLRIRCFPSQEICLNIFPQLKNLQALVMFDTEIVDGCLDLIGIYCENLRYVYMNRPIWPLGLKNTIFPVIFSLLMYYLY
jgi:hypothetical protein